MNAGPMVTGSLVGSALTLGIAGPAAAAAGAAAAWGEEIGSMAVGGGTIKIDIEQAPAIIAAWAGEWAAAEASRRTRSTTPRSS